MWCKQHAPSLVAAKRKAQSDEWANKRSTEQAAHLEAELLAFDIQKIYGLTAADIDFDWPGVITLSLAGARKLVTR